MAGRLNPLDVERQTKPGRYADGENVKGIELHFVLVLAGMQRVEVGDAVDTEHTASPSMTKCFCRFLSAASAIHG